MKSIIQYIVIACICMSTQISMAQNQLDGVQNPDIRNILTAASGIYEGDFSNQEVWVFYGIPVRPMIYLR